MARPMNLNKLPVEELITLRSQVEAVLSGKVARERRNIESQLAALARFNGAQGRRGRHSLRGSTVAPKYRNPDNPSETWAGRGLMPRWLTAAMKGGRKLEHFAIASAHGAGTRTPRGKTRRKSK